jgi:hypothetical protein
MELPIRKDSPYLSPRAILLYAVFVALWIVVTNR